MQGLLKSLVKHCSSEDNDGSVVQCFGVTLAKDIGHFKQDEEVYLFELDLDEDEIRIYKTQDDAENRSFHFFAVVLALAE